MAVIDKEDLENIQVYLEEKYGILASLAQVKRYRFILSIPEKAIQHLEAKVSDSGEKFDKKLLQSAKVKSKAVASGLSDDDVAAECAASFKSMVTGHLSSDRHAAYNGLLAWLEKWVDNAALASIRGPLYRPASEQLAKDNLLDKGEKNQQSVINDLYARKGWIAKTLSGRNKLTAAKEIAKGSEGEKQVKKDLGEDGLEELLYAKCSFEMLEDLYALWPNKKSSVDRYESALNEWLNKWASYNGRNYINRAMAANRYYDNISGVKITVSEDSKSYLEGLKKALGLTSIRESVDYLINLHASKEKKG